MDNPIGQWCSRKGLGEASLIEWSSLVIACKSYDMHSRITMFSPAVGMQGCAAEVARLVCWSVALLDRAFGSWSLLQEFLMLLSVWGDQQR